jgi:hypothetical protein
MLGSTEGDLLEQADRFHHMDSGKLIETEIQYAEVEL